MTTGVDDARWDIEMVRASEATSNSGGAGAPLCSDTGGDGDSSSSITSLQTRDASMHSAMEGSLTVTQATMTVFTIVLGAGIAFAPQLVRDAGIIPCLVCNAIAVAVVVWTGRYLTDTFSMWNSRANHVQDMMGTYEDMGRKTYGNGLYIVLQCLVTAFFFGLGAVYYILMKVSFGGLYKVVSDEKLSGWGADYFTFIAAAPMVCLCMLQDISVLAKLTPFAACCAFACVVAIIVQALCSISISSEWMEPEDQEMRSYFKGGVLTWGITVAKLTGSYGITATFPSVITEMRVQSDFKSTLNITMGTTLVMYTILLVVCWLAFGNFTAGDVTVNMGRMPANAQEAMTFNPTDGTPLSEGWTGQESKFWAGIFSSCMVVNILISYPLIQMCIWNAMQNLAPVRLRPGSMANYVTRVVVIGLEVLVAFVAEDGVGSLFGLVAAVILPMHAVFVPIICGYKARAMLNFDGPSAVEMIAHGGSLLFGLFLWGFGVWAAIKDF